VVAGHDGIPFAWLAVAERNHYGRANWRELWAAPGKCGTRKLRNPLTAPKKQSQAEYRWIKTTITGKSM
jgi:hypothetical protein